ncbi:glycine--tRNA ligase subunit beta [Tumebacillus sp. DT12]|uniref:Glycine--tRNA ligase beta subunit n=1 Tax=Tumebacillus lacus TaxID=2995335 RepID=A0ABT3X305_9BACL|nr:glycine--tRNA ligase subunit beta [Tumebacillus lacus]MCX7570836.1 glycine--tRNA ligase subunit beta [Tumebacillus lacus]
MTTTRDFLLEIGTEEIPARFLPDVLAQMESKFAAWMEEMRLTYTSLKSYATPRRMALLVQGLQTNQADLEEEMKGPAKKAAQDAEGNWTKAAEGFARGQGVSTADLFFKELNGVPYVFANKKTVGRATQDLLEQGLEKWITSMHFPKHMRWGTHDLWFVRPIRWLVALFGDDVIPLSITGVESGCATYGHRFLSNTDYQHENGAYTIPSPTAYIETLRNAFVLVDQDERRELILKQIDALAQAHNANVEIDEDLLEEVVHLVEWPTALMGSFEEEFLDVPQEVLITSMREHQRYFPVLDKAGKLLPNFVTVRNGDDRSLDVVRRGNEKVLRARLSDARFFYEEDKKTPISENLKKLETVVYHEDLGTVAEKVRRVRSLAGKLGQKLVLTDAEQATLDRAAEIAKFDLTTQMVYEFTELQGIMGEKYAKLHGESEAVAKAIFEHYLPRNAGDILPATLPGTVLSIAEKVDTIVASFAIGLKVSGSQDPYGLRRQAAAVVTNLLHHNLSLNLGDLVDLALEGIAAQGVGKVAPEQVKQDVLDFFTLRLETLLQEQNVRYDVINAVLAVAKGDVLATVGRAKAMMNALTDERFLPAVESFKRSNNLAKKAEGTAVSEEYLQDDAEKALYKRVRAVEEAVQPLLSSRDYDAILNELFGLKADIDGFFDKVMVMAEDENVRRNRLNLLNAVIHNVRLVADFGEIVA